MMRAAFYKGTRPGLAGLYSRAVRFLMAGPYSHCELVFSDGLSASSSFEDGGVRFKRIDFTDGNWDFLDLAGFDEERARGWFLQHEGAPYDLLGNLGFLWRPIIGGRNDWFCSEALAAALGFLDPWRFEPNVLYAALKERAAGYPDAMTRAQFGEVT